MQTLAASASPMALSARRATADRAVLGRSVARQQVAASRRVGRVAVRAAFVDGVADARIKVIGCGGGGGNAVNRMIMAGLQVWTGDTHAGLPTF